MKKWIPVLFVIPALFVASCSGEGENTTNDEAQNAPVDGQEQSATSADQQTHETDVYVLDIPEGWNLDVSHRMNTEFILFAPYDSTNNLFRENVNVLIDPVGDSLGLEGYVEHARGILAEHMEGFGNYRTRMEEDRAWMYYDGEQQTMILHFTQMLARKGNDIYIMTFTSNASNTPNEAVAQDIMRSFRFK